MNKNSGGGGVDSWFVSLTPNRAVWVRVLARDIVLCSFLFKTLDLHSASFHPGVQMGTGELNAEGGGGEG